MADVPLDTQERLELCGLFDELGPSVPTLIEGWTAHDLAAHLVLREHDLLAGPCLVLPGPFQRFAERRRAELAGRKDFTWLVGWIRSGPPCDWRLRRNRARSSRSSLASASYLAGPSASWFAKRPSCICQNFPCSLAASAATAAGRALACEGRGWCFQTIRRSFP